MLNNLSLNAAGDEESPQRKQIIEVPPALLAK